MNGDPVVVCDLANGDDEGVICVKRGKRLYHYRIVEFIPPDYTEEQLNGLLEFLTL